jgi:amino acid adenylation domain-containing protein
MSSTNIPSVPVIPNRQESAPPNAGWRTKLQSRRARRSIPRRADSSVPQLSFAQEQLWLLEQLEPGSPAYNRPLALRLTGLLDESALRRSLQAIIDRHEILRTRFMAGNGQALPVVSRSHTLQLPLIEPADADSAQRLEHARRLAREESLRPFDLAHESPFRATLLRLGSEEHVLLMVFHHIAFDGWSARVFLEELATLYRQFRSGELPWLPELPIQYSDFAHWQRREFASPKLTSASNYWKTQLSDVQPLDLPTDRPRPKVQSHHGACVVIVLPESLASSLKALGRQENATLFMVLLAAFQVLLARYSGMDDIAVGSPVAGRNWLETENLVGIFINILVLRSNLSGNPTFLEFLARVRETCRGAYRHQEISFSHVVEAVKPQRDLSTTPIFQVMFNLENLPESHTEIPGLRMEEFEFERDVADYELTLEIVPANGRLRCLFTYNTDIFDRSTVERMAGYYETLLQGIVAEPDRHTASLPLASPAEQHQVLVEWNQTEADYPRDATIHQLFKAQAARTPAGTAFYSESGNLSYGELDRRSNQLARYIRGQGVTPESLVGVCLNRSPEAIVAILGILKAGAAFVPLDPGYPRDRLEFMISDARIPLVISRKEWKPLIAAKSAQVICLDRDQPRIDAMESEARPNFSAPKNIAYILYTSGSSGVPKGVMGLHRGAVNRFAWMWKNFPFKPGEVCCLKTSFNFVDSIWEIFGPLLQGIPSVMLSDETGRDPAKMARNLARFGVTRIVTVPSLLRVMLESHPDLGTLLPAMRLWVSSGEALEPDLCRRFYQAMPQATLLNLYGSTEVAADVTAYVVPPNLDHRATVPLGRPIDNTRCYVLDAQLQPVPIGARGDLYVGGDGLARGYCNRPELTAECFRDDPFSTAPDARLYKTGDRARYFPDGKLEYLGRSDHQVKVRGFRIELREIEAVLSLHPQVAAAAATVQEGAAQDKHLVAYVVGQRGKTPLTAKALREFLKQKLPGYMVPAEFLILDSLPLTPSGKLDHRALHAKNPTPHAMNRYVPPEDPVEWQLVKIWEELLDIRPIGIGHDFFDLGGHSLLAIRMMDRIEQAYGRRLPLSTLFAEATVLHLADCLRLESVRECASPVVPVQTEGSRPPFFYLHGDLGGGLYCRTLAQLLGPDQPLYGVMPSGVDGRPFPRSVEAMAKENIRHLLAVQPESPYLLGGYCNGGVVAYEMARQLHRQGREVGMVILLDTWVPRYFGWLKAIVHNTRGPSRPDADRRAQVYMRLRNYLVRTHWAYHQGPRALLSLYLQKARRVIRQSLRSSDQEFGSQAPGSIDSDPWDFLGYPEFGRIISSYRPKPYPGRVILLRTRYLEESYPTDRTAGWGQLARNLEIHELPGDHHNCLTEHLGDVAEHIRRHLTGYLQTTDMELAENSRR